MAKAARSVAVGLLLAGAAFSSVGAYRDSRRSLALPLEEALARALRLPRSRVHVREARLVAPATLRITGLELGPLRIGALELDAELGSLLGGHPRLSHARASAVELDGAGRVAEVDASLAGGRAHALLRRLDGRRAGVDFELASLAVELTGRRVERAAFTGLRLGGPRGLDAITGNAWRDPNGEGHRLRAARPGFALDGTWRAGVLDARARLDALPLAPLAPLLRVAGFDLERAQATGELTLWHAGGAIRARGGVRVDELVVDQPSLARRRLGPISIALDGDVTVAAPVATVEKLYARLGPLGVHLSGYFDPRADFEARVTLDPVSCAEALRALPPDLLPALDGLTLDGRLGADAHLAGALEHLGDLQLDAALAVGCRVLDDPPLADPKTLAHALTARAGDRTLELGPSSPTWRNLRSLPEPVVRAFVVAEDGRFFQHHGFDLDMIRHALAQDLGTRRFERGASTITQQVAKNLFLSGERTAARKLEEAVLAWRIEQVVPKRRILELYLNLVELGPGIYGIAEAAERYFGKEPEELNGDEAAQLAALLPAPRRGMDAVWQRRYRALAARLPSEKLTIPPPIEAGTTRPRL